MTVKTIRLFQLFGYMLITSQLLFYLVAFGDALKAVPIANFLEHRKAADPIIATRYKIFYLGCLVVSLGVAIIAARKPGSVFFVTSLLALVCLVADIIIAVKGNMPLNDLINAYQAEAGIEDWEAIRSQWLDFIRFRGVLSFLGLSSLIIGLAIEK